MPEFPDGDYSIELCLEYRTAFLNLLKIEKELNSSMRDIAFLMHEQYSKAYYRHLHEFREVFHLTYQLFNDLLSMYLIARHAHLIGEIKEAADFNWQVLEILKNRKSDSFLFANSLSLNGEIGTHQHRVTLRMKMRRQDLRTGREI